MIVAGVLGAALAQAQPRPQQAKDHTNAGMAHAEAGRWEDALRELEQAYALDPTPIHLFDVAQARLKTNRVRAAVDAYAKLEGASSLPPEQQARVREALAEARAKIAHARITVPNARARDVVSIDGTVVARDVLVDLDPGHHVARLLREGASIEKGIDLDPGGSVTITLVAPTKDAPIAPPPAQAQESGIPTMTWVLGGASILTLSLGAYFSITGYRKYQRLRDDPCSKSKTCERIETNDMVTNIVAGDILITAGVTAAVAAAAWWFFSRSPAPKANVGAGSFAIAF